MAQEPSGVVFNIMRFSVDDGPGIRTTVFLKGCPLSCQWCHNPESRSAEPELIYFRERCRVCADCVPACPYGAIVLSDGAPAKLPLCRCCGTCVDACRAGARELAGRSWNLSELMREIERDVIFFDESGGGVTFSGGEPLFQAQFVEALADGCRERRIHTVLDTCGFARPDVFLRVAAKADLVYYDFKLANPAKHRAFTGVSNEVILNNLKALAEVGRAVVIRYPVIPGINDSEEDTAEAAAVLSGLRIERVDLLPYHRIGVDKYRRLGVEYQLEAAQPPPAERMRAIAGTFERAGLIVRRGEST